MVLCSSRLLQRPRLLRTQQKARIHQRRISTSTYSLQVASPSLRPPFSQNIQQILHHQTRGREGMSSPSRSPTGIFWLFPSGNESPSSYSRRVDCASRYVPSLPLSPSIHVYFRASCNRETSTKPSSSGNSSPSPARKSTQRQTQNLQRTICTLSTPNTRNSLRKRCLVTVDMVEQRFVVTWRVQECRAKERLLGVLSGEWVR
jgi:hypothetical protein